MRRWFIILLVIVGLLALAVGAFALRFARMARNVRAGTIENVSVAGIKDGTYEGAFGDFLVRVRVRVTVKAGRMESIDILDQRSGPGYEAKETVGRILSAQTPRVDAVSGATGSSRCIMIAVSRALAAAPPSSAP